MKASLSSPESHSTLISTSSCVIFILTNIIGNFGVSDADVVLRQNGQPNLTPPHGSSTTSVSSSNSHSAVQSSLAVGLVDATSSATTSFSPTNRFSENTSTTTSTTSTPMDSPEYQKNLLQNLRIHDKSVTSSESRTSKSTANNIYPLTSSSTTSIRDNEHLYSHLLPSSAQRQSLTPSGFHKRAVRKASDDELPHLKDSESKGVDIGYSLPLSMDDYWALDRDRLLDQLVIRTLAKPGEWAELRKSFDKVDGDLKTLLSMEKRRNQAISDVNTSTDGSPGYSAPAFGSTSAHINDAIFTFSSTQNQEKTGGAANVEHHHHHFKFAYHRVPDLNAAGQPTSRGIAAVVSLDNSAESGNESKNETVKSTGSSIKAFSGENAPSSGYLSADKMARVTVSTSSKPFPSTSHSDGPLSRGGGSESSNANNYNNKDNIRNTFSRLTNKREQVDLASDKIGGSGVSSESDNSEKGESSASNNNNKLPETNSAHVFLPQEESMLGQGNSHKSHKIRWEPSRHHEQVKTVRDGKTDNNENPRLPFPSKLQDEKESVIMDGVHPFLNQDQKADELHRSHGDNNNDDLHHQRHHPARHHHHHFADRTDQIFHKFSHHHHNLRKHEVQHQPLNFDKDVHEEKFLPYHNIEHHHIHHILQQNKPITQNFGQHQHQKYHHKHLSEREPHTGHRNHHNKYNENFNDLSRKRFQIDNAADA